MQTLTPKQLSAATGAAYTTILLWLKTGRLQGTLTDTPRGPVWLIPASALDNFTPPQRGRPKKAEDKSCVK